MVKLLERHGLAFGADTNASTGFERTTYMLDLPRNDPELLDIALMLMRETASELTFNPAAVARERGVIQAEKTCRKKTQPIITSPMVLAFLLARRRFIQGITMTGIK